MVLNDVVLCGRYALGFKEDNFVPATHLWREDARRVCPYEKPKRRLDGLTVSLVTIWGKNYFHWITECLAILCGMDFDRIDHILIPKWYKNYCMESLTYLKVAHKVTIWDETPTTVDLIDENAPRVDGYSDTQKLNRVMDYFKVNQQGQERIWISRSDAGTRKVVNENKIADKLGYTIIVPGKLRFMEQVETFSNATDIIGPHGAGMTNLVWSKKARVTELFGSYKNDCYEKLCKTLQMDYTKVMCTPIRDNMRYE